MEYPREGVEKSLFYQLILNAQSNDNHWMDSKNYK